MRTPTQPYHEIDYDGEITAGEQFRMVGQVEVDSGAAPDRTFSLVTLHLLYGKVFDGRTRKLQAIVRWLYH